MSEEAVQANRAIWEVAAEKYVRESDELLEQARTGSSLIDAELEILGPVLYRAPTVVHLQSGHGLDDLALIGAGARRVIGVDYSAVTVLAAAGRAAQLGRACHYVVARLPPTPLRTACADLVYTGKGALAWMPDLQAWADETARLLTPDGHLFVYESHPMAPLYTRDRDRPRLRPDRGYFARSHINDTFPARGATEWQWTLGEIITAVVHAGLEVCALAEYPEPFWRPAEITAAAWEGQLPNTFSLLARRHPA